MSRPKQSNGFRLSAAQSNALNAVSRSLPRERRPAFLLNVLSNLKVATHSVSDQQVQAAIAHALAEYTT
jgi:hypothetical protein